MRIAVVGGTGRVGSALVEKLRTAGHCVCAASRRNGVDTITREGLQDAINGSDVVVDVVDSHSVEEGHARWFFETSTHHVLAAERAAQVRHHVALSMIGAGRIPGGYFAAKLAQEQRVRSAGIPYSIVQSTQVFELLGDVADDATDGQLVRLAPVGIQPVALGDLATVLAQVAVTSPLNGTIAVAGPERLDLVSATQRVLAATRDTREVVSDRHAYYLGAELAGADEFLLPQLRITETKLEDWLLAGAQTTRPGDVPRLSGSHG